jgi:thioesterase domain-containing protein
MIRIKTYSNPSKITGGVVSILAFHHCGGDGTTFKDLFNCFDNDAINLYTIVLPNRMGHKRSYISIDETADEVINTLKTKVQDDSYFECLPFIFFGK